MVITTRSVPFKCISLESASSFDFGEDRHNPWINSVKLFSQSHMAYKNYIKKPVSKTMSLLSTFAEFTQCEARQIVFFFFGITWRLWNNIVSTLDTSLSRTCASKPVFCRYIFNEQSFWLRWSPIPLVKSALNLINSSLQPEVAMASPSTFRSSSTSFRKLRSYEDLRRLVRIASSHLSKYSQSN